MFPPRDLVVTGASGFLGSEVARLAQVSGWRVRVLVHNQETSIQGAETIRCDIGDLTSLREACSGASALVHTAGLAHVFGREARDSKRFTAVNETGTDNVIKAALESNLRQVVLASSVSVYGSPGVVCDESLPCLPASPYAVSKWHGELRAMERMAHTGKSLAILRFATIYGEGDRGNVAKLIAAIKRNCFVHIGSGENQKSLIYKTDAARACMLALEHPVSGADVFNVTAEPVTMNDIVSCICTALGRPAPSVRLHESVLKAVIGIARGIGDPRNLGLQLSKMMRDDVYDGSKFNAAFDFSPEVSLAEGLRREVNYFVRNLLT